MYSLKLNLLLVIFLFTALLTINAQQDEEAYIRTLTERSQRIVNTLNIADTIAYHRVIDILVNRYRSLGLIHDGSDSEDIKKMKLYDLHCEFIGKLGAELMPEQIDKIKDGMTSNALKVNYDAFCDMIPTLKPEEKRQIMAWFIEAREHAISAGSSQKRLDWFIKYRGRCNNYLSSRGYDLQQERKDWEERRKAEQNR